jgi:hypothetical protein
MMIAVRHLEEKWKVQGARKLSEGFVTPVLE